MSTQDHEKNKRIASTVQWLNDGAHPVSWIDFLDLSCGGERLREAKLKKLREERERAGEAKKGSEG